MLETLSTWCYNFEEAKKRKEGKERTPITTYITPKSEKYHEREKWSHIYTHTPIYTYIYLYTHHTNGRKREGKAAIN